MEEIQIDIWSDVVCPFCYIGKRSLEKGIAMSGLGDRVHITWHSFLLDPEMKEHVGESVIQYLAKRKGISEEQSQAMHAQVTERAAEFGLHYRFDQAKIANTLFAHTLIQKAHERDEAGAMEEVLFKAYFCEGKDLNDIDTLKQLGQEGGLQEAECAHALQTDDYKFAVWNDVKMAQDIGIQGVPFFIFNRRFAISGAQNADVFRDAIIQASQNPPPPKQK